MRKGFTLIEMIVVLVILATVTHLAVREMSHIKNGRMRDIAESQFKEIKDSVFCIADGRATGFVADMGRLPRAHISTNSFNMECVTLEELWKRPEGVGRYEVRQAIAANLIAEDKYKTDLEDSEVWIACGWRGPYLNCRSKDFKLTDAWGNRIENKDDAGYDRLFTPAGNAARVGESISKIFHYGSDGRMDSEVVPQLELQKDFSIEFLPPASISNVLALNVLFSDGEKASPVTGDVVCKWYAPCGSSITGGLERASVAGVASKTFSIRGLPPGQCMVTLGVGGEIRLRKYITVPPGGGTYEVKVPVR